MITVIHNKPEYSQKVSWGDICSKMGVYRGTHNMSGDYYIVVLAKGVRPFYFSISGKWFTHCCEEWENNTYYELPVDVSITFSPKIP